MATIAMATGIVTADAVNHTILMPLTVYAGLGVSRKPTTVAATTVAAGGIQTLAAAFANGYDY